MVSGLFLQYAGFFGGGFGNLLASWEQAGIFAYVLPFLLIFSIVFGILTRIDLFKENRTINAILALSIGLMSLQFEIVPYFFSELFPRVGIGLAIILVVLIFTMLFSNPDDRWQMYLLWAVSAITVIIIVFQSSYATGLGFASWLPYLGYYWQELAAIILFIVVIAVVIISARPANTNLMNSPMAQILRTSMGQPAPKSK